jgi:thiamine biosynthesis lipoprotein
MIDMTDTTLRSEELRWRAMGSDAHVVIVGGSTGLLERAHARIATLEQRWSRFIDDSEVCELRRRAGSWVPVSDDTVRLVELGIEGWRLSGASFDPLVLDDVERAGYVRTFTEIPHGRVATPQPAGGRRELGRRRPLATKPDQWRRPFPPAIEVRRGAVRLPVGCGFDPGGIGKGFAADLVVAELIAAGAAGACVNLGGDLRVVGRAPAGGDWTIAVDDPAGAPGGMHDVLVEIAVRDGAVATSSTQRRRWTIDGDERHHLIDPCTGEPSTTDLASVTVIAGAGWSAEVLAKAALLRGADRWLDILPAGIEGLAVDIDGHAHTTSGFARFTANAPAAR